MNPLAFLERELRALDAASLRRRVRSIEPLPGGRARLEGRTLLNLSSNDYLGLALDPRVIDAAARAAERYGAGAGAARLVTGSTPLHDELEDALAAWKGTEAALLFSSGYLANLGAIAALVGPGDVVASDEWNHASIVDAARLSRAEVRVYRHADPGHCRALLHGVRGRRALVVTDGVFSMDGDLAPLNELAEACDEHGAIMMVDEAHAAGVVGPGGAGTVALHGLTARVPVIMGTLSKALGSAGGFIAGSRTLIEFLRNRARAFVFDTALPPASVAAALEALRVLQAEPERPARVRAHAASLAHGLRTAGLDVPEPRAAIVPFVVGDAERTLELSRRLEDAGVLAPAIRPPSVPSGTSRLRFSVSAAHAEGDIASAVDAIVAACADRAGSPA